MPRVTPGLWYDYFSGPIFSSTVVTVMLVPGGRTFYLDYLSFGTFNTIPDLCTLILVGDGVPLLMLTSDRFSTQQNFDPPVVLTNSLTMQPLGTLDATKNMLVTFRGAVL